MLCQQSCDNHAARIWHKTYCAVCSLVCSADTAQPRKRSNVTRPFPILWVGSGDRLHLFPDPHMRKPERGSDLLQDFLALLSQHVRKMGKPIRTQDSKQSCDFNAYWMEHRLVPIPIVYSHWNRPVRPKHMTNIIVLIHAKKSYETLFSGGCT